jgi:hypothetical protein
MKLQPAVYKNVYYDQNEAVFSIFESYCEICENFLS